MQQVTINFDAGIAESYASCREYVAARIHQQGRPQKSIAADMDYSPSILSRKLSPSESDTSKFTLDDLEKFIQTTGDVQPVYYLVEKYLADSDEIASLERRLIELRHREAIAKRGGKQT